MQQVTPGQANVVTYGVINKTTVDPITSGTVAFYLRCKTGTNADKWWKGSDSTWSATEESAGSAAHTGSGIWKLSIATLAWTAGARYDLYAIESDNLNIIAPEEVLCETPVTGTGSYRIQITVQDSDSDVLQGARVAASTDASGENVQEDGTTDNFGHVTFRLSAGVYKLWVSKAGHNFSSPYNVTVSANDTNTYVVTATTATASAADTAWTRTTLCNQLINELAISRDAPSGGIPDKLANIATLAFEYVHSCHPWLWRRKRGTISLSTETSVLRLGDWSGTSEATLGGSYSGTKMDIWTATCTAAGTIGEETVTVVVTDYEGLTVATLSLGSAYTPGDASTVRNGITLAFSAGTLVLGDSLTVALKTSTAIFMLRDYGGAAGSEVDYSDFSKLDQGWLDENDQNGTLQFTSNIGEFERFRKSELGQTGLPALAIIEFDRDIANQQNASKLIRVAPAPNGAWSYDFVYLVKAPTLGDDTLPLWEPFMNSLWYHRAKMMAAIEYQKPEGVWQAAKISFNEVLEDAKGEQDEHHVSRPVFVTDPYNDIANLTSSSGVPYATDAHTGQLRP